MAFYTRAELQSVGQEYLRHTRETSAPFLSSSLAIRYACTTLRFKHRCACPTIRHPKTVGTGAAEAARAMLAQRPRQNSLERMAGKVNRHSVGPDLSQGAAWRVLVGANIDGRADGSRAAVVVDS